MSKFLSAFRIDGKLFAWSLLDWACVVAVVVVLMLALAHNAHAAGIVICSEHGVRSAATGNKKVVFDGSKRHDYCEYTHLLRDLSGSHKFWSECQ